MQNQVSFKQRYNNLLLKPGKVPFFYGWVILAVATVGILVSAPGQTTGVSTFTDYLLENIRISRDQISMAYMFGTIASSFILTYAGKLYDRYGARWVGMGTSLLLATVLVLLSQSDRIIHLLAPATSSSYVGVAVAVLILFFFMLRFSGQGVLTMVSRNMLMKWFIARRGLVNGISSLFVSLGFSVAPLTFYMLIQETSWRMAWLWMALAIGVFFTAFVFVFYRDNPEDLNMIPDGEKHGNREHNVTIRPFKQFTLKEARKSATLWLFALPLAIYALYITGFTFHLVSLFEAAGIGRDEALAIFIPSSFIAVTISLLGGWISDRIKLVYLLYLMLFAELLALFCMAHMAHGIYYLGFIVGHGITSGVYNVLMAVTWPRYYGREHLGKITGFVMSLIVFGSALGPILFSLSYTRLGSYSYGIYVMIVVVAVLGALSYKARNPQDKFVQ
ncbi:MFS transporter [Maribellus sp. YY47]|uniref:MFS transporter n=1 Tax=Maribellus sp. YY47 TaxID=2929486 RepID=UPI002000C918|nr:MFS transporter [Maribellus sp. YY47]MCK3684802.1 MFS transporter [Maribellus sp. YY47]